MGDDNIAGMIAVVLSVFALIFSFTFGMYMVFSANEDITILEDKVNSLSADLTQSQNTIKSVQSSVAIINLKDNSYEVSALEDRLDRIDYCAERYDDTDDYYRYANCIL